MPITDALPDMQREIAFFPCTNSRPKKLTVEQIQQYNKGYIALNVLHQRKPQPTVRILMRYATPKKPVTTATPSTAVPTLPRP